MKRIKWVLYHIKCWYWRNFTPTITIATRHKLPLGMIISDGKSEALHIGKNKMKQLK